MHPLRAISKEGRTNSASRGTAILAALAVWILGLLVSSPQWHAALHSGASQQDHSCAVTLFAHGMDHATGSSCLASAPMLSPAGDPVIRPALPVADAPYRLPPACGPPLC